MGHKSLKDAAAANPTQIGDPVSLKAETSDHIPKPSEEGASQKPTLKETAQKQLKENPTALGDPISMKAETSDTEPTPNDRGASQGNQNGKPKM